MLSLWFPIFLVSEPTTLELQSSIILYTHVFVVSDFQRLAICLQQYNLSSRPDDDYCNNARVYTSFSAWAAVSRIRYLLRDTYMYVGRACRHVFFIYFSEYFFPIFCDLAHGFDRRRIKKYLSVTLHYFNYIFLPRKVRGGRGYRVGWVWVSSQVYFNDCRTWPEEIHTLTRRTTCMYCDWWYS